MKKHPCRALAAVLGLLLTAVLTAAAPPAVSVQPPPDVSPGVSASPSVSPSTSTSTAAAPTESPEAANHWDEAEAYLYKGVVYASIRAVAARLAPDISFTWQGSTATAIATADGLFLEATLEQPYLTVNTRTVYLPEGVQHRNGRVTAPLELLAELLGGSVTWQGEDSFTLQTGTGRPEPAPYTEEDLYWMARVISAESRGEPLEGKIAVGTVVLNRVASEEFPGDICSVVFDRQWGVQFTPVANGSIWLEPTEESVLAAKLVLEGARAAGDSLYFIAPHLTDNHWVMEHQEYVTTIGAHWFYR